MRTCNVLVALLLFVAAEQHVSATWNIPNLLGGHFGGHQSGPNFSGLGGAPGRRNFHGGNFGRGVLSQKAGILQNIWDTITGKSPQQAVAQGNSAQGLKVGFYSAKCPKAEEIIRNTVQTHFNKDPTIAAGILRMFFHDCFVGGCDASILLDKTPTGETTEKFAFANGFTLRGLEVIDDAKSALEAACPGNVSCADIISFATRDASVLSGIQSFPMAGGRRDATASRASEVPQSLPDPLSNVDKITQMFNQRGFSQEEMVVLLGAHSIGGAHCFTFTNRLYKVTDPALDANMAQQLKNACPESKLDSDVTNDAKVNFDQTSPLVLDGSYYQQILNGKALITSDHSLMTNPKSKEIVSRLAANPENWKKQFSHAMVKLSTLGVLVGNQGEIRKQCRAVNSGSQQFPRIPFLSGRGF